MDGDDWGYETKIMRQVPLEKLRAGAAAAADKSLFPADGDLVISGDIDEIPDAQALLNLKHCEPKQQEVSGYFSSNFYVLNFDYSLGVLKLPRIQTWSSITKVLPRLQAMQTEGENYGSGYHLNGFMNEYGILLKELSLAEGGHLGKNDAGLQRWRDALMDPKKVQKFSSRGSRVCCALSDDCCASEKQKLQTGQAVPWFALANKHRFPHLFPSACKQNPEECKVPIGDK